MSPSRAPFSGELQMPPLLLLILPCFWVHPSPSQVHLSIPFAFSPIYLTIFFSNFLSKFPKFT